MKLSRVTTGQNLSNGDSEAKRERSETLATLVPAMSAGELEEMVGNMGKSLERARRFVSDQEEELIEQIVAIADLGAKLPSAGEGERQSLLQQLADESEKVEMLEATLKGQRYNLSQLEAIYELYRNLLPDNRQYPLDNEWPARLEPSHSLPDDCSPTALLAGSETPQLATFPQPLVRWGIPFRILLLGMVLGVGLAALGSKLLPLASQNQAQPAAKKEALTPAQTVTATTVTATTVDRTLKATGTVTAYESIPVLSQATGFQIQQVLVDEGDRVVAGQVLASLDSSAQQAELLQARANVAQVEARLAELKAGNRSEEVARARELVIRIEAEESMAQSDWDLAKTRVKRNQSLAAEGAIARDRLDEVLNEERAKQSMVQQAQARLREARQQLRELEAGARPEAIAQARAQLAQAKAQVLGVETRLRDTTVVAPASGKVAERFARVGDITSGSQKLFSIIENDRLELQLKIPETQLPRLRVGQTATITSDIDPSLRLTARIRELKPLVDANSRQAIAVLDLPDRPNLKPGMFLRAAVVVERVPRLTVPMEAAIPKTNRQAIAYVLQPDRTVRAQTVTLGEILPDNRVEVLSGLAPGDRVAVKGAAYLSDGDRVSVAPLE